MADSRFRFNAVAHERTTKELDTGHRSRCRYCMSSPGPRQPYWAEPTLNGTRIDCYGTGRTFTGIVVGGTSQSAMYAVTVSVFGTVKVPELMAVPPRVVRAIFPVTAPVEYRAPDFQK
jgi:hypothetical protein